MTGKRQVEWGAAARVVLLLVVCVSAQAGCRQLIYSYAYTREEPRRESLVGVWEPDEATQRDMRGRGGYDTDARPTKIVLRPDGSAEVVNRPDWWGDGFGQSSRQMRNDSGTWRVSAEGGYWAIELKLSDGFTRAKLLGQRPPYRAEVVLGDPDTGQSMFFAHAAP